MPLLDLWFAANAKAYVLTVAANAKGKDVHVLPNRHAGPLAAPQVCLSLLLL